MWIPLSVRCPPTPNTERPTGTPNSWDTTPWWRCGQRPQEILHSRLRGGSSQKGAAHFVVEAVNRVRRAGAAGPLTVRADSGFWSYRLIADLDRRACIHVCVRWVFYCCGWCESWPERRCFYDAPIFVKSFVG